MCSTFNGGVRLAFLGLMLILAGSAGTVAHAQALTATLTTDRGCGASAVYNLGERNTFFFSTSQTAQVTLTLRRPDGTISTLLANQILQGGITYALNGVIGNPPGQRTLALDAVAGSQTAHMECTYSAQAVASTLTATLQTNKGCSSAALFNLGEQNRFLFSTSQSAQVTLTLVRPDGTTSTLLANQPIQGGITYAINGVIGNPLGQRRLLLHAVAGSQTADVECDYTAQGTTNTLTANLTTDRGCGSSALYNLGDPTIFSYSASQNAQITLTLVRPDGTTSILANRVVQGGVTYTINGVVGNPPGQRRLLLHAVAGSQTADMECDYTAQGTTTPLTVSLTTDRGCGASAVYNVGDPNLFSYSASQNAQVTLTLVRPDGTSSILASRVVQGGVIYTTNGVIDNPPGQQRLLLHAVAGSQTADMECDFTVSGTPVTMPPPAGAPTVTGVSCPHSGDPQPGGTVTLTGSNFGATQDTSFVDVTGPTFSAATMAAVISWSDTMIVVQAPNDINGVPFTNESGGGFMLTVHRADGQTATSPDFDVSSCKGGP